MSQASAYEQFMLELVNAERAKVGAQPLAFNGDLNESAEAHSRWMIATDTFSHTGAGGSTPTQRMKDAGYVFSGSWASAENIAWASTRAPAGLQDEVQLLHTNLMNSSGHRTNILNGSFREIGIGFDTGSYKQWDGAFVTQNFARSGSAVFLTGVALDDRDGDRFYDVGEALGGLKVTATGSAGTFTATTQTAGGYTLALKPGTYKITFSGGGITPVTKTVSIGNSNVKLDLVDPAVGTSATSSAPSQTVAGTTDQDVLYGTSSNDAIKGYDGGDRLYGRDGADRVYGANGNDALIGDKGNDRLSGGSGKDKLRGGEGKDYLIGGAGADAFQFTKRWGADKIHDFRDGVDLIDMSRTGLEFEDLRIVQRDADRDGRADDAVIFADGHTIALLNVKAALIGASDFSF